MAEITASMVKELREATGLGMMECKKALSETNGDFKAAEELLRIKSGAKASKAATRVTAEGVVASYISADGKSGAVVELNCETDFVAKNDDFIAFARNLAQTVAQQNPADVAALAEQSIANGAGSVEETRKALVMKLGENVTVRRFVRYTSAAGKLATYLHGSKIGVIVDFSGEDALGKDIAMHIGQVFVKDEDGKQTIEQLLKSKNATVAKFQMFVVGEGIEKRVEDYAAEVAAAAAAAKKG